MSDMSQDYDYDLDEDDYEAMSKSQLKRLAVQMEDENKKLVLSECPSAVVVKRPCMHWPTFCKVTIVDASCCEYMDVELGSGNTEELAWKNAADNLRREHD